MMICCMDFEYLFYDVIMGWFVGVSVDVDVDIVIEVILLK